MLIMTVARYRHVVAALGVSAVAGTVGAVAGGVNAFANVQAQLPFPLVYIKSEVPGDTIDRDPPKDPKLQIRFANVGQGPLFVREWHWLSRGEKIKSIKGSVESGKDWTITSESTGVLGKRNKPLMHGAKFAYLTLRPTDGHDKDAEWKKHALQALRNADLELEIRYTYFQGLPFGRTMRIPLMSKPSEESD